MHLDRYGYLDSGCETYSKDPNPDKLKFKVNNKYHKDYESALKAAKQITNKTKEDTEVWAVKATVQLPLVDLKVVEEAN